MKHLSKILMASLFMLSFTLMNAQDKNNPWAIRAGINVVDHYPVGATAPQGSLFDNFFETDHWNTLPAVSEISAYRYLGSGLSAKIDGSMNKIKKFGDERVNDLSYYAINGGVDYSFGHLIFNEPAGWFDPYLGLSAGSTWIDHKAEFLGNVEFGLNFWLNDFIALNVSSQYRGALNHNYTDYSHFQHFAGLRIAFGGKDTDGDGIYDHEDDCPDEPGLPEFNGCPDSDGDGIPDHEDDCPDEPGLPEFNGCPDTDGDGVPDHEDECPTEPGLPEFDGCPDSDGDGVPDHKDDCPDEAGPEENNGCPWPDRDGDGIPDKDDECPDVPGTKENNGCPDEPTVEVVKKLNDYSKKILFDLSKATIRDDSAEELEAIADVMEKYPNAEFHLAGFTDNTGSEAFNTKLSKDRAAAVKDWLVDKHDIDSDRLSSEGYGPKNPVATNSTEEGREQNRRVEIILKKDKDDLEEDME